MHIEPQFGYTFTEIVNLAKKAEQLNFHHFTVSDHFFGSPELPPMNSYEAWTLIALLTPLTRTIRLGTEVTCQSYRNPALLAKIVANLDNASKGRIDLGLGAGWKEAEYRAYGIEFPPTGVRIKQLREAVEIIKRLWTEKQPPSFQGEYYQIETVKFLPKPVQSPHVPLWIGTQTLKAPTMENIIAKYADGIIYDACPIDVLQQKQERMRKVCEAQGRDYGPLKWWICAAPLVWKDDEQFEEIKRILRSAYPRLRDANLDSLKDRWLFGPIEKIESGVHLYEANDVDRLTLCLPLLPLSPDLGARGMDALEIFSQRFLH